MWLMFECFTDLELWRWKNYFNFCVLLVAAISLDNNLKSLKRWLSPFLVSIASPMLINFLLALQKNSWLWIWASWIGFFNQTLNFILPLKIGKCMENLADYMHIFTTLIGLKYWILGKTEWLIENNMKLCVHILTGLMLVGEQETTLLLDLQMKNLSPTSEIWIVVSWKWLQR